MKLRITSDQIRFRLSDKEVKALGEGVTLLLAVHFGAGSHAMNCEIIPAIDEMFIHAYHNEGCITVSLPLDQATKWANSEEEGIYATIKTEIGSSLSIAIEKDYPCKH
jgi:hypothetical protein